MSTAFFHPDEFFLVNKINGLADSFINLLKNMDIFFEKNYLLFMTGWIVYVY